MGIVFLIERFIRFWEAAQVELHGSYSVERVRELIAYNQRTSTFRALLVLFLMPWPSVIITLLADLIPLRPPSDGLHANYLFIVRTFIAFWVASTVINLQFRHNVPAVPLPNTRVIVSSAFTAALTTICFYATSLVIGFPLPFGILTLSPAWVLFLLIPLFSWLKRARSNPEVWPLVINTLKIWVGTEILVLIYPTYFYIFTTLPGKAKTPFACLLPIIKLLLRNVISRTVVHLNDEIPEVVSMNVEVFNSLFMSYCMQNTPSIWTTLGLITIDGAQMMASMHDVSVVIRRLTTLKKRVDAAHARRSIIDPTATEPKDLGRKTILVYAHDILNRYKLTQITQVRVTSAHPTGSVVPLDPKTKPMSNRELSKQIVYSPSILALAKPASIFSLRKVFSARGNDSIVGKPDVTQLELEYALQVRKVLYITEFMVLINYVEVIVPIIFSANLVAMYYLPNRVYYPQIVNMDDDQLRDTLGNVMLYCFLQLVSLVILFFVLWRKLHISALRQLSFVLETQGEQVQTKLVLWVFYNVQATLQHFASDYTFKFAWLHGTAK